MVSKYTYAYFSKQKEADQLHDRATAAESETQAFKKKLSEEQRLRTNAFESTYQLQCRLNDMRDKVKQRELDLGAAEQSKIDEMMARDAAVEMLAARLSQWSTWAAASRSAFSNMPCLAMPAARGRSRSPAPTRARSPEYDG